MFFPKMFDHTVNSGTASTWTTSKRRKRESQTKKKRVVVVVVIIIMIYLESLESESRWTAASFSSRLPKLSAFQLNGRKTSCM